MKRRGARRRSLALLAGVVVAWACAGCGALHDERRATFGFDFRLAEPAEQPSAVVFFVDGLNARVFEEMLAADRLPNLKRYFVDRGLYIERCLANIPSVTLANQTSFVTGLFPGHHNIMGVNWFDRNSLLWRNYETVAQKNTLAGDYVAPTIYERLCDATTLSLFFQAHRGATKFAENRMSAAPPYLFGWYRLVDRIALLRFSIVADVAKKRGEFPALVIAYQLAPDMAAYHSGVSSEAYRDALRHTDAHIGRVLRDFEAARLLDRLVLVLISDHGMGDVLRHWPVEKFLRDELRLAVARKHLWEKTRFEDRLNYYRKFSCVLYGSGERYAAICLRKPRTGDGDPKHPAFENWLVRPPPQDLRAYPTRDGGRVDLIRRLRDAEAVDVVAYRAGPNRVHLVTKRGLVELARESAGGPIALRVLQGDDPLGYGQTVPTSMLYGKPHDAQAWLEATADTQYPDLVPQIIAYFDAPRAGDIAVFAAPGWDFGNHLKAGHGGVRPEDMLVPLLMAGPGVPHTRHPGPVRAVDLVPTLLDLLGRPVPADLDGRSLLRSGPVKGAGPAPKASI